MFFLHHALQEFQQSSHFGFRALHRNIRNRCLSFPFSSQSLHRPAAAWPLSHPPPFPALPRHQFRVSTQAIGLYFQEMSANWPLKHNSCCYFLRSVFRHSSMSSLRARKRSLITPAAAASYNVKFLKCKCILENYSPLDLPPPPPLTTPRHESGAAQWKSPGTCRCIITLSFVLLSLTKMRTIIIIGVFSLGIWCLNEVL